MRLVLVLLAIMGLGGPSGLGEVSSAAAFPVRKAYSAELATTTTSTTTTTTIPPTTTTTVGKRKYIRPQSSTPIQGTGACGGDLPPCWVMMRESRGNIIAKNPSSSASGKWQMLDSTWNGYGGYAHASDAPEAVQDAKARTLAPCHWQPPNYCA